MDIENWSLDRVLESRRLFIFLLGVWAAAFGSLLYIYILASTEVTAYWIILGVLSILIFASAMYGSNELRLRLNWRGGDFLWWVLTTVNFVGLTTVNTAWYYLLPDSSYLEKYFPREVVVIVILAMMLTAFALTLVSANQARLALKDWRHERRSPGK